ncbi:MAG: hypothetical protein A3F41_05315 [Coxiella sp. RIFCSPHIGHO2_12_FULL_44_14]|nr:MAG: hypothetical protein A3F41_05315 [Coxiella sp. RIFCSPHIGHO2_12_FULL_44_14]
MLLQRPQGVSPRFPCHPDYFSSIAQALNTIGHVVIEAIFDQKILDRCQQYAHDLFAQIRTDYEKGKFTKGQTSAYFSSTYSFRPDPPGAQHSQLFMSMIGRSSVLDLYSYLLKGDIAALHGPVVRRVDPTFPQGYTGLHADDQVTDYAEHAFKSKDIYTMWTPFDHVTEETSTLLLLSQAWRLVDENHQPTNINNPKKLKKVFLYNAFKDFSLDVTPMYLHHLPQKELTQQELSEFNQQHHQQLKELIETLGSDLYAPTVNQGSVIIFKYPTVHGSYLHNRMTQLRYSADIRFIGDFDVLAPFTFVHQEKIYFFKRYTQYIYDHARNTAPSLAVQVNELHHQLTVQQEQIAILSRRIIPTIKRAVKPILKKLGLLPYFRKE